MKTSRILATTIASPLLTSTLFAAIHTWDGGGANDNLSTALNWVGNTAPASNLASTDLIFSGGVRLHPDLTSSFRAHSITFDNVVAAGTFGFGIDTALPGVALFVGTGGIVNNDSHTAAFDFGLSVDFSEVANSTINAASGDVYFETIVLLPMGTLTVTGSHDTSFVNDLGGANVLTLNKTGSGAIMWWLERGVYYDVTVGAGTLTLVDDNSVDVFNPGASIAVNGTSVFNVNAGLTLDAATFTRAIGADINLKAGKTLTVQGGGDVAITGAYSNATASTITVTGAGSSFTGSSTLGFNGGSVLNVLAGGIVAATGMNVGTSGDGTVAVSGSGSSLSAGALNVALSGNQGTLTFSSSSTGMFSAINVGASVVGGTDGTLSVLSGADVTGTGLVIGLNAVANHGSVGVSGSGSTLTLTGAATATIGATSASTGALSISSGGAFTSGTGTTTVNATGLINIVGGTYTSNGDLTLVAGHLARDAAGVLTLAAGTTFTIQGGGDATITGSFSNNTASTIHLSGGGSALTTTGTLSINGGSTLVAAVGSDVSTGGSAVNVGTSGNGTVSVANTGSSLSAGTMNVGNNGNTASVTFSNNSTGTLGAINVDTSTNAGTSGSLAIQSGATVTGTGLAVATQAFANTGTVSITGASSALTLTGAATATIGETSASIGALNVQSSGTFNSGTGLTTVNVTGTIAIGTIANLGGTFNANGNVTLNGGHLTRDSAGAFNLASGKTLTVQAGGDATFTGGYAAPSNATINVSGAGSTFSTTSSLSLGSGNTTAISAGGHIDSGSAGTFIGTSGGNGAVTVDGSGSSLSGDALSVGQNGFTGNLTFTNGGTGSFNGISVDASGVSGTVGTLSIQSGASVTGTSLNLASNAASNVGFITITGAGSALTLSGAATIGAAGGSTATVNVQSGGTFTTGTGLTTVNATGTLNINSGGTMIVLGDMNVLNGIAGAGAIHWTGDLRPGSSPAAITCAPQAFFATSSGLTMEIGGLTPGTQHDQMTFTHAATPQVTWGGTLTVTLINGFTPVAGDAFDLLDFDPARDAAAFDTVSLPPLSAGLAWNASELYTTGTLRVVAGGLTFTTWAIASGIPGALPNDDHDSDGYDNATEFALGLFPLQPATMLPNGGFHTYADGERLRLLFTRPLDRTGVTLRVQASSDLVVWEDLAISVDSQPFTGDGFVSENRAHPLSEPGLVEVRDILNASTATRRQMRVLITLTP